MDFNPPPDPDESDSLLSADADRSTFTVLADPVIAESSATTPPEEGLPRSYGSEMLVLMPRDPQSLFAYWDIDWKAAFGQENPRQRQVILRVLDQDGAEHTAIEVEPMAGSCYVEVADADAAYRGEIGYFNPAGIWKVVARSETVSVPAALEGVNGPADFATVPFHLSFQRMMDALRVAQEENQSLTAALSELRERVASADQSNAITAQQRELVRVVEETAAREPPTPARGSASPDLWALHNREKIFGFGNSSLNGGFGGSSRS